VLSAAKKVRLKADTRVVQMAVQKGLWRVASWENTWVEWMAVLRAVMWAVLMVASKAVWSAVLRAVRWAVLKVVSMVGLWDAKKAVMLVGDLVDLRAGMKGSCWVEPRVVKRDSH
jgi:hypothetical protein